LLIQVDVQNPATRTDETPGRSHGAQETDGSEEVKADPTQRCIIPVQVEYGFPEDFSEWPLWSQGILESVPGECGKNWTYKIHGNVDNYDSSYGELENMEIVISYDRLESDDEMNARLKSEDAARAQKEINAETAAIKREQKDREEYFRLRQKYGDA
jgi:hypothetical protein